MTFAELKPADKRIVLDHVVIEFNGEGCRSTFPDGSETTAWPHSEDPHYSVIAHRCGYGDDLRRYCQEHDFVHHFLWQRLFRSASPVLWAEAHRVKHCPKEAALEELMVQSFQRWMRANEEPIVASIDWHKLKRHALAILGN